MWYECSPVLRMRLSNKTISKSGLVRLRLYFIEIMPRCIFVALLAINLSQLYLASVRIKYANNIPLRNIHCSNAIHNYHSHIRTILGNERSRYVSKVISHWPRPSHVTWGPEIVNEIESTVAQNMNSLRAIAVRKYTWYSLKYSLFNQVKSARWLLLAWYLFSTGHLQSSWWRRPIGTY